MTTGQKECEWCHKPIIISTFNSIYSMAMPEINKYVNTYKKALEENPNDMSLNKSIAMCYLKLRIYDKALLAFEKAAEDNFDDSEIYFYSAICLLNGKKAFLNQRSVIDKILEQINAALMIEPKGIYYYYLAYIKYDYFERKHFRTTPNYTEALQMAYKTGISDFDVEQLYRILNVEKPANLII